MAKRNRGRRARNRSWRASLWIVAGLLALAAALWAVVASIGGSTAASPPLPAAAPSRTPLPTPYAGMPTVGRLLPSPTPLPLETPLPLAMAEDLRLPSTTDSSLALRDYRGKRVMLFFYASPT